MVKNRRLTVLLVTYFFISFGAVCAAHSADVKAEKTLHIDIPVKLEKANVVFNIDHLAFTGDMPFAIAPLGLIAHHFNDWKPKAELSLSFTRMQVT